jgi:hypothetical protein
MKRPDVQKVLGSLKDFQRVSVEYVFSRFYTDPDRTHRFLLADEVGLGKTLVAKGVVAKTIDYLWDRRERIDIIYICSSGDIARQNVDRLNITGKPDWALASRATLLPSQIRDIQKRKVNFVAFTPGTTFQLSSSAGRADERVLLYCMLENAWGFKGTAPRNVFQGYVENHEWFRRQLSGYDRKRIEPLLQKRFIEALEHKDAVTTALGSPSLKEQFHALCDTFGRVRTHIAKEERRAQTFFLGELRSVLAATCIRALEPDLVILDEFQRFKDLLSTDEENESDESALARELFDYTEEDEKTRILLLSATPYKMYTTVDELATDDHYSDFLQTAAFLYDDATKTEKLRALLQQYRNAICQVGSFAQDPSIVRDALQTELRKIIARTERLASSDDRNGMLREVPAKDIALTISEIDSYRQLQRLADRLDQPDTIEYWKAAPYLLSFMDEYQIKRKFEETLEDSETVADVSSVRELFLPDRLLRGRARVDIPHSRLNWLIETCLDGGAWQLLWVPACAPYYQPENVYAKASVAGFTKRLLFSAWHVVPKAVAALLSHEAERRMLEGSGAPRESLTTVRDNISSPLQFRRSDKGLGGMPLLAVIYPSTFLARVGDPYRVGNSSDTGLRTRDYVLQEIGKTIQPSLDKEIRRLGNASGPVDESWYWKAPLLLDLQEDAIRTREWLRRSDIAQCWSGQAEEGADTAADDNTGWGDHVKAAGDFVIANPKLGPPPADLTSLLAEIALGAPANVALRALTRVVDGERGEVNAAIREGAGQIAWALRNLFNLPEAIALIRTTHPGEPYWRRIVQYCIDGNLQAVMDEYVHVLKESLGLFDHEQTEIVQKIVAEIKHSSGLRSAPVIVDELVGGAEPQLKKRRLRARFAARFGEDVDIDDKKANRKDLVRAAFNSPFWPFVLATTSVGQEGLDFHHYCHAVIHWNLPSNPVDLEQREGRVHRYKGHAVRKNIAQRFCSKTDSARDPWAAMFDHGREGRSLGASDIVPYWVYPIPGGASIERHVPKLPLSREEARFQSLRRALTLYRMVFGQPRQEELLSYLANTLSEEEKCHWVAQVRVDLSPTAAPIEAIATVTQNAQ